MHIENVIRAIQDGQVRISDHAVEAAEDDQLTLDEIYFSTVQGEIIENYPEHRKKPYPRCLIFGQTRDGQPVHSVWAYNRETQWAVLVTVYRPDPALWINWRERRL